MATPPNMPPPGGDFSQVGQGPATGYPGGFPQGQAPLPPAKKSNLWLWLVGGCFGLLLLLVLAVSVLGYFGFRAFQESTGLNAEDTEKRPAFAAAKLITALNPDIELVSADEETQRITIREKSTGKEVTVTLDELQQGRITFTNEQGEEVTMEATSEGETGSLRIRGPDGTAVLQAEGGKTPEFPSWAPVPAGVFTSSQRMKSNNTLIISGTLKAELSLPDLADWLEAEAQQRGLVVRMKNVSTTTDGDGLMFTATSEGDKRTLTAMGGQKTGAKAEILYSVQEKQ